ncbi:helix-turn-helix domain-containing protein [Streptomyces sp. NPDC057757]|uniref:helix-turn-helix domain-containing protein n=1 Tax=Streptomyces sp. NPDC057757 TaxID=3346241 RepID=UPI0036776124
MKMVGALIGVFRRTAGYTQRELAERLMVDEQTLASIEQGRRSLRAEYAEFLDELLDTKGALSVAVANMPEVDLFPRWAEEYIDLEREALALSSYQNQALPGLLQTREYARAVFRNDVPVLSGDEIEQRAAARMERQEVLRRESPTTASFIISEAALKDRLGGNEVYAEQLLRLHEWAGLPGVTVQVMPLGRDFHAGLSGPFVLVETADHQRVAYVEGQLNGRLIADPDEVSVLERKYAMLRTQALNPQETRSLLGRLLGEQ